MGAGLARNLADARVSEGKMLLGEIAYVGRPEPSVWRGQAASLVVHGAVLAILAFVMPPPLPNGASSEEDVEWMRRILRVTSAMVDDQRGGGGPSGGERADEEPPSRSAAEGEFPRNLPIHARRRLGGLAASTERNAAGRAGSVASFGMIGLLSSAQPAPDGALGSAWERVPDDPALFGSGRAGAWGGAFGDGFGAGGLDLSGTGEGGGGRGGGIAIGGVGTVGHDCAEGLGSRFGCGCKGHLGAAGHVTRAPVLGCGEPDPAAPGGWSCDGLAVSGRLAPEIIQDIVRQSFGRFRLCYEDALRDNPSIEGRVTVKFAIDREGYVAIAEAESVDVPAGVVACVGRAFEALSFPKPEGGIVTVVYPLVLSPAN